MTISPFNPSVDINLNEIMRRFEGNELFAYRNIGIKHLGFNADIVYLTVLVDENRLNQYIIRKMNMDLLNTSLPSEINLIDSLQSLGDVINLYNVEDVLSYMADAYFVLIVEGHGEAYGMKLPGFESRPVEEPQIELNKVYW